MHTYCMQNSKHPTTHLLDRFTSLSRFNESTCRAFDVASTVDLRAKRGVKPFETSGSRGQTIVAICSTWVFITTSFHTLANRNRH